MQSNKNDFKFNTALQKQKKQHTKTIKEMQESHQKQIKKNETLNKDQIENLKTFGENRSKTLNERFEKKFQDQLKHNESMLSKLEKSKDKILRDFQSEMIQKAQGFKEKQGDNFYHLKEFSKKVHQDDQETIITLDIPQHLADKVQLKAQQRDITLEMLRSFEHKSNNDDSKSSISRVETLSETFSVDKILDSRKVSRSYADGKLTFKILHA